MPLGYLRGFVVCLDIYHGHLTFRICTEYVRGDLDCESVCIYTIRIDLAVEDPQYLPKQLITQSAPFN